MKKKELWKKKPKVLALLASLASASFGLDPTNLYVRTGVQAGIPHGAGLSTRVAAYLVNLEAGISYGYYVNTAQLGFGIRLPVGERNEIFLNLGGDRILWERLNLNPSYGAWAEIQHERRFGRRGLSTFAAVGMAVYPEHSELVTAYVLPVLKVGIRKEILGGLR